MITDVNVTGNDVELSAQSEFDVTINLGGIPGQQGDPGLGNGNWTYELPTGTKNGSNKLFTLAHSPAIVPIVFWGSAGGAAAMLYGTDFTYSGTALTLITFAPAATDYFFVYYIY